MNFTLKLAGICVGVEHRYLYIKRICTDYLSEDDPAFSVSVTDIQIEAERQLTGERFSKEICEATCIHREIVKGLVNYGIILIHSAVIAVDGEAYVFMARSGVGKSTHIRLWQEQFGENAVVVNGDKPMFSYVGDTLTVHGSPWKGKENWGKNISLPVKAFCLLERGEQNEIAPCDHSIIVKRIFNQVLMPTNGGEVALFMGLINRIIKDTPFYRLKCNMEKDAALVAYNGMRKV